MRPKVSVIVPAYNAEKYIEQCVESLLEQTIENIEIIIIDDGSTDRTAKILNEYAVKDNRIRLFHQKNCGLYKTRERALEYVNGEYVGWVDADDFVAPEMFEKLYKLAEEKAADCVFCNYEFFPARIKTKEKWFRPYLGKKDVDFLERNSQPWNKIVKTSLLKELKIGELFTTCFDEAYIKVLMNAKNPVSIDEKLYFYRMSDATMSSSYKNVEHYREFIQASTALKKEMLKKYGENVYYREYFEYREIYYTIQTMLVSANARDRSSYLTLKSSLSHYTYDYHKNQHISKILTRNFGRFKAVAIEWFVPSCYTIAVLLSKLAFS